MRAAAYQLVMYLKTKRLTPILLWESPQLVGEGFVVTDVGVSFLVDAIVLLRFVEIDSAVRKALVILKMRGSNHDKNLTEFEITSRGIRILPSFANYEGVMSGAPTKTPQERFAEMFAARAKGEGQMNE